MVYLGVFPTALAFLTWAYALARTTAAKMGATTYVVPAIVIAMSWLLLAEVPGWLTLVGGVLCLAGVAISRAPLSQATERRQERDRSGSIAPIPGVLTRQSSLDGRASGGSTPQSMSCSVSSPGVMS